ncbi:MAG: hypothetical protein WDW38_008900 [Sanguina aurantia]
MGTSPADHALISMFLLALSSLYQASFKILGLKDIEQRRKKAIEDVISILSVPADDAVRMLRKFKWDVNRVNEEWFSNNEEVCSAVGIVESQPKAPSSQAQEETCLICYDSYMRTDMRSAPCGHLYCCDCMRGYIGSAVVEGPAVLDLRCMSRGAKGEKCNAAVSTAVRDLPVLSAIVYEPLPAPRPVNQYVTTNIDLLLDRRVGWKIARIHVGPVSDRIDSGRQPLRTPNRDASVDTTAAAPRAAAGFERCTRIHAGCCSRVSHP